MASAPQPAVGLRHPQSLAGAACLCSGQGTGLFIHSFISINPPPARCSLCVLCSCSCWPCSLPWAEPPPWLWSRDLCSAQLQPCTGAVCCHLELTFPISWVRSIPSDHCCLLSLQLHAGLCDPGWRRPRLLELVFHFLGCWYHVCSDKFKVGPCLGPGAGAPLGAWGASLSPVLLCKEWEYPKVSPQ